MATNNDTVHLAWAALVNFQLGKLPTDQTNPSALQALQWQRDGEKELLRLVPDLGQTGQNITTADGDHSYPFTTDNILHRQFTVVRLEDNNQWHTLRYKDYSEILKESPQWGSGDAQDVKGRPTHWTIISSGADAPDEIGLKPTPDRIYTVAAIYQLFNSLLAYPANDRWLINGTFGLDSGVKLDRENFNDSQNFIDRPRKIKVTVSSKADTTAGYIRVIGVDQNDDWVRTIQQTSPTELVKTLGTKIDGKYDGEPLKFTNSGAETAVTTTTTFKKVIEVVNTSPGTELNNRELDMGIAGGSITDFSDSLVSTVSLVHDEAAHTIGPLYMAYRYHGARGDLERSKDFFGQWQREVREWVRHFQSNPSEDLYVMGHTASGVRQPPRHRGRFAFS